MHLHLGAGSPSTTSTWEPPSCGELELSELRAAAGWAATYVFYQCCCFMNCPAKLPPLLNTLASCVCLPPCRYGVPASDADGFEAVARQRAYGPAVEQTQKEGGSEEEVRTAWRLGWLCCRRGAEEHAQLAGCLLLARHLHLVGAIQCWLCPMRAPWHTPCAPLKLCSLRPAPPPLRRCGCRLRRR